jgi:branched-chain amino acid aminotransferase
MLAKNFSARLTAQLKSVNAACRPFSVYEKTFMAGDLIVKPSANLKQKPGPDHTYLFGGITTDHMLEIDYDRENGGWQRPQIVENKPFQLMPENATLNFSIECFEGAKAYKTVDNRVMMYRVDQNFRRMNSSHTQLGIPNFDIHQMIQSVKKLIEIEKDWIPEKPMHSLYLRPTSISMDNRLGLSKINKSKTFVILSPVGPYYPRGFVPVKLYCDTTTVRAWPTGFGDKKVGG